MNSFQLLLLAFLITALSVPAGIGGVAQTNDAKTDQAKTDTKGKHKFTISKETTYILGPIDKDGYIDYAAALNERLSKGVTPENNANVLIWKAIGPTPDGSPLPGEFFKLMGMDPPPEKAEYFVNIYKYAKEIAKLNLTVDEIHDQLDRCVQQPWSAKEFPHVAEWLRASAKPLALVIDGANLPRNFSPKLISKNEKGMINLLSQEAQSLRHIVPALAARAMLRVEAGLHTEAWQDLQACHRLGIHWAGCSTLTEYLIGIFMDAIACGADHQFLAHTKLSQDKLKACMQDLHALPRIPGPGSCIDLGDRFFFLDFLTRLDNESLRSFAWLITPNMKKALEPLKDGVQGIDIDPALKSMNKSLNRVVNALKQEDRTARERELGVLISEVRSLKEELLKEKSLTDATARVNRSLELKSLYFAEVFTAFLDMPQLTKPLQNAADRTDQRHLNLLFAFSLEVYERDNGHYPKDLSALVPKYLPEIPTDLFSGKALIYRPSEKGYLIYSVGPNGVDDQGRGVDDDPPGGDDLAVRMPLPKLQKK